MWLAQLLERNRQCFPGRTALVDEDRSVTWAEFHDRTAELARGPADLGIERGDRVAVLSHRAGADNSAGKIVKKLLRV
ncbi:hypothetical protein SALBM135S_05041 [Streptomyces alboniger]